MSTRETIEDLKRRLAELERDLGNEGAERHVYNAETGERVAADDGGGKADGNDLLAEMDAAGSFDAAVDVIRRRGAEHGVYVVGEAPDEAEYVTELEGEDRQEFDRKLAEASNQDEAMAVIREYGLPVVGD